MAAALKAERRSSARMSPGGCGTMRARLRPGRTAWVLDLSAGGALIETDWRVFPGTRVELHLGEPAPTFRVTARILRCHVAGLERERVRYRAGLCFEQELPVGELKTPTTWWRS